MGLEVRSWVPPIDLVVFLHVGAWVPFGIPWASGGLTQFRLFLELGGNVGVSKFRFP